MNDQQFQEILNRLEEVINRLDALAASLGGPTSARPPHGHPGGYRVGEWGELYMPILDEFARKAQEKYPDGYMYPPGVQPGPPPAGSFDYRTKVVIPKAVMWPGTIDYFNTTLSDKQKNCILANHSRFIFLLQANSYGWRFAPQAFQAGVSDDGKRWEYYNILDDVWTTTKTDHDTIEKLNNAIRSFMKKAYDLE